MGFFFLLLLFFPPAKPCTPTLEAVGFDFKYRQPAAILRLDNPCSESFHYWGYEDGKPLYQTEFVASNDEHYNMWCGTGAGSRELTSGRHVLFSAELSSAHHSALEPIRILVNYRGSQSDEDLTVRSTTIRAPRLEWVLRHEAWTDKPLVHPGETIKVTSRLTNTSKKAVSIADYEVTRFLDLKPGGLHAEMRPEGREEDEEAPLMFRVLQPGESRSISTVYDLENRDDVHVERVFLTLEYCYFGDPPDQEAFAPNGCVTSNEFGFLFDPAETK